MSRACKLSLEDSREADALPVREALVGRQEVPHSVAVCDSYTRVTGSFG